MIDSESFCNDTYCGSLKGLWFRVLINAIILYSLIAFFCWEEIRFLTSGVNLEGKIEWIRNGQSRKYKNRLQVRYTYLDPVTGRRRLKTTWLPKTDRPTSKVVPVQYIGGDMPLSRLASQAHPYAITV